MKLVNTYYNLELNIVENQIAVLSVENPAAYTKIVGDMWHQVNGEEGSFILSDGEKIKNISKDIECIFNPFSLDCNNKKIITRLYQELRMQSDNLLQEETARLNCNIIEYLERLIMTVPYNLKFNCDMDITSMMKMYGVEIDNQTDGILENVVEYIKVVSQICGIKTFVAIDIKHYLTDEELLKLYEAVFYEKINLVIIEPIHTNKISNEKCWIIDKDLCIIDL
ncbi:MAG: type II-A CRISPR-associated protein Csn2 [Lachnospiraceae bacterium]|nr:type II-A CRISPR-associated protein Csn2 [Lachnospiraceae bacterium]